MSLSYLIRRRVHPVTVFCRHASTATKRTSQRMLPDEKLRALVSLYHQADNFITIENLSERIDEAFITKSKHTMGYASSVKSLTDFVELQRREPRLVEWTSASQTLADDVNNTGWKEVQRKREMKVKQALYGLDFKDGNVPGLEIVRDAAASEGARLKRLKRDASGLVEEENNKH